LEFGYWDFPERSEGRMLSWIGFIISLVAILIIARKSLPLALFCGAIILGFFTLPVISIFEKIIFTITDLSILLLALAMGVIPMIGGTMKQSGQMDDLVNNLRIGRKGLMALSPAIMGLLPMPGGALLSAPILEKGGTGVADDLKTAINDWFRHLFVMIYPLSSALIASAKISDLSVYTALLYLLPTFAFATFLGIIFFISKVQGSIAYTSDFSLKKLLIPLGIILIAPVLDFSLKSIFNFPIKEIATLIGVSTAFIFSLQLSPVKLNLKDISKKMKPWNFTFIILGMFVFLHIFKASNVADLIAGIPLSPATLCVVAGFLLGIATGRVLLPASIMFPVYLTSGAITPVIFAIIYTSIFFGYVISPVHPCVCVTIEYFNVSMKNFFKLLIVPTLIIFLIVLLISFLV
jgi:integral membrane protein (TIGR00529 family)